MLYMIAAAVIISGTLYWNARQYVWTSLDQLLQAEAKRTETLVKDMYSAILTPPSETAVGEAWVDVRAEMRRYGASKHEIDGVCKAADIAKRPDPSCEQGIYAVPVYVRPAWVQSRKVWVIGYACESKDSWDNASLSHYRTCVFDAAPPHELLSSAGCM